MKQNRFILIFSMLLMWVTQVHSQHSPKTLLPIKQLTVMPADIAQPGSGIERVSDGKRQADSEIFHTLWGGISRQNITIEADIDGKGKRLDEVVLWPRASGHNGIIKNVELWIMTKGKYKNVANVKADRSNSPLQVELDKPIPNPQKIKLVITDSYGDFNSDVYLVSLGELECFMLPDDAVTKAKLAGDSQVFADKIGLALKPGVKKRDIEKMQVPALKQQAMQLFNNTYKADNLVAEYQPYQNPSVLGKRMRIGDGFSKYEGITGIVLEKGEHLIFMGETKGARVKLLVPDWTRKPPEGIKPEKDPAGWGLHKEEFVLSEGVNRVRLTKGGLVYIQYFVDDNPEAHEPVKVHFPSGKYNGYFDVTRGDTDEDFNSLLDNAISPIMDMRGKNIQVAYPVEQLKKYTYNKGLELIKNYDTLLGLQRKFMGWDKEGLFPKNHILARVNYNYYMFRDGDGVAYMDWAIKLVADPKSVITGDPCWGFSHETGHVNQMRPQMTWGGMTEVSNNLFTLYCCTAFGNKSRLAEQNTYAKAREVILDKGISYMGSSGQMGEGASQYGGGGNTDVFQRLVPFWQLHLYFTEQGYPDFYADLMIAMRNQKPLGEGHKSKDYLNMLEFCRLASQVSKTDLTEFFERWGFFYVGAIHVQDYGSYTYQVSQSEVDDVKNAIAKMNLPKPKKDITLMED